MGITLTTTTHNRPEAFALLEKWVAAQTLKPDRWLVINDSTDEVQERYQYNMGQSVFRPKHTGELHSLCANWVFALQHIKHDRCIIAEDDDYIAPRFVEVLDEALNRAPLAGLSEDCYYNVRLQEFRQPSNVSYASLACTGFRQGVVPLLRTIARRGDPYLDVPLWEGWRGEKVLVPNKQNGKPLHVGIKGMYLASEPGAGVSGLSHYEHSGSFDWNHSLLKDWLGADAHTYISISEKWKASKILN